MSVEFRNVRNSELTFVRRFWFRPLLWLQFRTLASIAVIYSFNGTGGICKLEHMPGKLTLREASVPSDTRLSLELLDCTQPNSRILQNEGYKRPK